MKVENLTPKAIARMAGYRVKFTNRFTNGEYIWEDITGEDGSSGEICGAFKSEQEAHEHCCTWNNLIEPSKA